MLFSKRKLKAFRQCLLSQTLEMFLILTYLILFPISVHISSFSTAYESPQENTIDNFNSRQNVKEYFFPGADFVKEGYAENYTWVYSYLNTLLHERLWEPKKFRPYSSVGSVRLI